jgi:hypothetical protein
MVADPASLMRWKPDVTLPPKGYANGLMDVVANLKVGPFPLIDAGVIMTRW